MEFRKPTLEDIDKLSEFMYLLDLDSVSKIRDMQVWLSRIINATLHNKCAAIVAEGDNKIVGFIALVPMRNRLFEVFIGVDKEHRNQGLGTQLVKLLLAEIDQLNAKYNFNLMRIVKIRVRRDNIPSRKLFSKFCKHVGEDRDYLIYRFVS